MTAEAGKVLLLYRMGLSSGARRARRIAKNRKFISWGFPGLPRRTFIAITNLPHGTNKPIKVLYLPAVTPCKYVYSRIHYPFLSVGGGRFCAAPRVHQLCQSLIRASSNTCAGHCRGYMLQYWRYCTVVSIFIFRARTTCGNEPGASPPR